MLNKFSAQCLSYLGVNPLKPVNKLRVFLYFTLTMVLVSFLLVRLFTKKTVDPAESLSIIGLVFSNYLTLISGRKRFKRLFADAKNFWEINAEDGDTMLMLRIIRMTIGFLKYCLVVGASVYILKPFATDEKSVLSMYHPPGIPSGLLFFIESSYVVLTVCCYYSCSTMACSMLVTTAIQFRALNLSIRALNNSNVDMNKGVIKGIVKYHQFLIRYVNEINKLFALPLVLYICAGTSILCVEMYRLVMSQDTLLIRCKICQLSLCMTAQFFCVFGLPAQLLMDHTTDTAKIIYCELDWYLPHLVPFKRDLMFMTSRSQKGVTLRAAYYYVVNNQTIVMVARTAYTFCAFMQTMSET